MMPTGCANARLVTGFAGAHRGHLVQYHRNLAPQILHRNLLAPQFKNWIFAGDE
jgi:hypothetical protein